MPFSKRALTFFRGLARRNEKPWFEAHREEYESEVRQPMRELIEDLDTRFAEFAPEIGGNPKKSMFRINRDIRFSKDKSPYNPRCLLVSPPERSSHRRGRGGRRQRRLLLSPRAGRAIDDRCRYLDAAAAAAEHVAQGHRR